MKVLDPGHKYEVENYDGDGTQLITFLKREGPGYPYNVGHYKGTNLQEIFCVAIDRMEYLDSQNEAMGKVDPENKQIIINSKDSFWLLEKRAARNHHKDFPYSIFHPDDLYKFPKGLDGHVLIDLFKPLIDEACSYQPWRTDVEGEGK